MYRIKGIAFFSLALTISGCINPPQTRMPGIEVMHFPFAVAFDAANKSLVVSSQSSDRKYDFGRLLAINTNKVLTAPDKDPIPFGSVVTANMLIPLDAGPIILTPKHVVFASRQDEHIYAVQKNGASLYCNDPETSIAECAYAHKLKLSGRDPFSIALFNNGPNINIMASFQGSDSIELLGLDDDGFSLKKQISGEKLFEIKNIKLKKNRLITRKIFISNPDNFNTARIYILMEKYAKKISANINSKGAIILSFLAKYLAANAEITKDQIEYQDLKEDFGINSAQDMLVTQDSIYILARVPQTLYKIDLNDKKKFITQPMCSGATSMSADLANNKLFIPCFNDNRVISLALNSFQRNGDSGYLGRGPAMIAVDAANNRIFVSLNIEGTVMILDYNLKPQGRLFEKAAINRMGS